MEYATLSRSAYSQQLADRISRYRQPSSSGFRSPGRPKACLWNGSTDQWFKTWHMGQRAERPRPGARGD